MISKAIRGKTFYGACRYICGDERRATMLEAEGVRGYDYRMMARDFEAQHSLRPGLGKPVFHGILSFYPGEKPDDETITKIARDYLKHLGIKDTQYVITKHTDKNHLHLHILANMVNNRGETIKDNYIGLRSKKAAELITIGYGLREAKGKDLGKTSVESLNEREATRYKIYSIISEHLPKCKMMEELEEALKRKGIETLYKFKGVTSEKQGVSFTFGDYKFKGSEVDRNYSINGLQKQITQNINHKIVITKTLDTTALPKVLSENSRTSARERYLSMKQTSLLKTLLKPEEENNLQPQSLLPKKRKKKKRL